jgi:hypothetical protein
MRIDGKPVLAVDQVGKGKVIWLGFNILTHIWFYLNQQEAQLIRNTVEYALASYHEGWINNLIMDKRPYGYIDMSFRVADTRSFWLLISETYFPGWKARVNGAITPLQTAEPGLIAMKIGGSLSYEVTLQYEYTEVHYAGWVITILTFAVMTIVLLVPKSKWRPKTNLVVSRETPDLQTSC